MILDVVQVLMNYNYVTDINGTIRCIFVDIFVLSTLIKYSPKQQDLRRTAMLKYSTDNNWMEQKSTNDIASLINRTLQELCAGNLVAMGGKVFL